MSLWRILGLCAIGWYLFLVALHYFLQRPLWNDEYCVFLSIRQFSPVDIFSRPLLDVQVFPRLYLWCIQQFSAVFDFSLLSLRFFPLVSMLAGFALWIHIARRELKSERLLFLFLLSWAGSAFLVYYAAELKQYSFDVFAAGCACLFLSCQKDLAQGPRWRYLALLAGLPVLALFSYPAFLFLVFPLWNMLSSLKRRSSEWQVIAVYVLSALVVAVCSYLFDMRLRSIDVVRGYEEYFISFSSLSAFGKTLAEGISNLLGRHFAEDPRWVRLPARIFMAMGFILMFWGWGAAFRREGRRFVSVATIAGIVFLEICILGALKVYPFIVPRTVLFFFPILLILSLQAMERLREINFRAGGAIQILYGIFVAVISSGIVQAAGTGELKTFLAGFLPGR